MEKEIMVYYDITAWEKVKVDDFEELKDRCPKICNMLNGLGIMKFIIRIDNEEEIPQVGEQIEQPETK